MGPLWPARVDNGSSCLSFSEESTAQPNIHVHSYIWTTYMVNSDEQLTGWHKTKWNLKIPDSKVGKMFFSPLNLSPADFWEVLRSL